MFYVNYPEHRIAAEGWAGLLCGFDNTLAGWGRGAFGKDRQALTTLRLRSNHV
jgi:hypothetical protein